MGELESLLRGYPTLLVSTTRTVPSRSLANTDSDAVFCNGSENDIPALLAFRCRIDVLFLKVLCRFFELAMTAEVRNYDSESRDRCRMEVMTAHHTHEHPTKIISCARPRFRSLWTSRRNTFRYRGSTYQQDHTFINFSSIVLIP